MTELAQHLILTVAGQYEPWHGIMAFSFVAALSLFACVSPLWASRMWEEERR